MKRGFGSICKRIAVILLGAALLCLFSACASNSNDKDVNYKTESSAVENSPVDELDNWNQPLEAGTEQPQISPDIISEQSQIPSNENSEQSSNISNEQSENPVLSIGESYKAILLGNGDFISTDLGNKELNIEDIGEVVTDDDSITVQASKFTIIDLDGDGENEVVLWIQINRISDYGFEILHYQEGAVYGYTLPYRTFFNLKTDGTFLFSGGAADPGIGKLRFSMDGYAIESIIGEVYSEEDFNAAISQQEEKMDVDWYDLSVGGVNIIFP
ncbi:MAG: hypothetical protein J1E83_09225 [Lachnospiraceae bacterium]|nr:hypothetical protein [Lachnospiraceae bacterium]